MDTELVKQIILANAAEIDRLQAVYHATCTKAWREVPVNGFAALRAYHEFVASWNVLAFPGGYKNGALARIGAGDPEAMETALCFLELRPYFFRSGYMFKDILRKCRNAPLSAEQAKRLAVYEEKLADWTRRRAPMQTELRKPVVVNPKPEPWIH
jgi:hypothetical protein